MRQKILLIVAVFFGLLAFMFTYQQINQEKRRIQSSTEERYLVQVVNDLSEGEKISKEDIRVVKMRRFVNDGRDEIPWSQHENIIGREVFVMIEKGSILNFKDLRSSISTGRTGLSARTAYGYRAIAIPVDSIASVAGLVQPNNYVDIIGTFRFPDTKGDSSLDTLTLTVLQRVRVLATGSDMGMHAIDGAGRTSARSYSSVTLELTPKEAEMIVFAMQKGRLTLSLRSYEDVQFTRDVQSVDWEFLRKNVEAYNAEREMRNKAR